MMTIQAEDAATQDFLFTWKPKHWPRENIRRLVDTFLSRGSAEEWWSCSAHKKIHVGDHGYFLQQGKPMGIFGRGTVIHNPRRRPEPKPGDSLWQVLICFDALHGDVLWDPADKFLVNRDQLLALPVPKKQWQNQASGITLARNAARAIDAIIFDSVMIGRREATWVDEALQEVARVKKLAEQRRRPGQQRFSDSIRTNYRGKCAVTECATSAALEAAHISTQKDLDNNDPANGILLRSDIHALFDRLLITISEDGARIEVSPELTDPAYASLNAAVVARPYEGSPPSAENIRAHRKRFLERVRLRSGNSSK